jgi:transglutaminase-like putative cysteine protease
VLSADAQNPRLFAALLATVHLLLFAMVVRLFSARTTRDYMFLALLAFASMLASAILTVDTAFLFFFLVFLALAVSTFIGFEMRRSAEGAASPPMEPGTLPARRLHVALGVTSGAIAVGALVLGSVIFFALPRFNAGYLSGFNLQPSLISGFSDDVELGEIGQIKRSEAVVMRIQVDGDPTPAREMHWRGIALTTFDGRRWYSEARDASAVSQGPDGWVTLDGPERAAAQYSKPFRYTVMLEPLASDAIFVAAEPQRIRGQFAGDVGGAAPRALRRTYLVIDKTGSLSNPFHNFSNVRYDAVSELPRIPAENLRSAPATYTPEFLATYLQLPQLDPRIPLLAQRIVGKADNSYDRARAIELYLRTRYGYTLDLTGTPPADPLAYFLFDKRAGHCEYFAAAMTVMLRSLGVPARYVNGFLPGEYNDVGGDFIIRARDAHSWVEVFFPGYGWQTFDPTPPAPDQPLSAMAELGLYWDWFQLQWGEWVINYDFLHQFTLAQGLQRASRSWTDQLRVRFENARAAGEQRVHQWEVHVTAAPVWLLVAFGALLAAALALRNATVRERLILGWKLRSGQGPLPSHVASLSYRRMLRLLEQRGWSKSPAQTPLEFAASLPPGAAAQPVADITEMYLAARFGERNADPARFTALLANLQAALRGRSPRASAVQKG